MSPAAPTCKRLTPRQAEVLHLLAHGCPDREIADQLGVSLTTVRQHVEDVRAVFSARNRAHAVYRAFQFGQLAPAGPP